MQLFENKTAQQLIDNTSYVELILTEGCNMRCKYCFQHSKTDSIISEQTIDKVLQICKDNNIKEITLFGGEPVSKFTLERLKYIRDNYDGWLSITSNGYDLSDEIIEWYESVKDRCSVQISIDGLEDNHDINRIDKYGNGTFITVIKNIYKLSSILGYNRISLRSVLVPSNIEGLPQFALFIQSLMTDKIIRICRFGFDQSGTIKYDHTQVENVLREIFKMYQEGYIGIKLLKSIFNEHKLYSNHRPTMCNICKSMLFINPEGYAVDCHFSIGKKNNQDAFMFNINTGWINPNFESFIKIASSNENMRNSQGELCKDCRAISVCAICKSASRYITGDDTVTPYNVCLNHRSVFKVFNEYVPDYGDPALVLDKLIEELKTTKDEKRLREIQTYLEIVE